MFAWHAEYTDSQYGDSHYADFIPFEVAAGLHLALIAVLVAIIILQKKQNDQTIRKIIHDLTSFAENPHAQQKISESQESKAPIHTAFNRIKITIQNELIHREKLAAMGEAIAKINHDMRNVLASAMLVGENLERTEDPKAKRAAKIVNTAIERASILCGQMMQFAEIPTKNNNDAIQPKQAAMEAIIKECADEMGIKIDYNGPDEMMVDSVYFFRLIHNLVNNAQKAAATEVSITIWKTKTFAIMDIADNGPGMDEEVKKLLFKPFAGSTRGSAGLGLCISRDVARAHGGELKLTRSNKNGSEFRLKLPVKVLGEVTAGNFWSK